MARFLARRALGALLLLLAVSVIAFALGRALPGDPAQAILGLRATPEAIARIRADLGLERSLAVQYLLWLRGLLVLDFGVSMSTAAGSGRPVADLIAQGFVISASLTLLGTLLATAIGIPMGLVGAASPGSTLDRALALASVVGLSVPAFYMAFLLILLFTVQLGWLPSVGYVSPAESVPGFLRSVLLPVLAIGLINAGAIARTARAAAVEVIGAEATRLLRLRGAPALVIHLKHVLRNALIPIITVIGLQLGYLMGGVVVIENMFALPGMGRQLLIAVEQRDYTALQGLIMVFAAVFVAVNLAIDLCYAVIDPRVEQA